jgi:type VI secretion system protein VasD
MGSATVRTAILLVVMLALVGCASGPPKRDAVPVEVRASAFVNPDTSGRPSPVVVYLLSLRSIDGLGSVALSNIIDGPANALASDLVSFRQVTLLPGEVKSLDIDVSSDTRFVAVVGALQAYQQMQWKDYVEYSSGVIAGLPGRRRMAVDINETGVRFDRSR